MPTCIAIGDGDVFLGWSAWCLACNWTTLIRAATEEQGEADAQLLLDTHLAQHAQADLAAMGAGVLTNPQHNHHVGALAPENRRTHHGRVTY